MSKNNVFIGYDYDKDKAAKDRLLGLDASIKNSISLPTTGPSTSRSTATRQTSSNRNVISGRFHARQVGH